jgi:RNA recognition motif-containing protein
MEKPCILTNSVIYLRYCLVECADAVLIRICSSWHLIFLGDYVMETKLYVGNLSYSTTEDELRSIFAQAGTVVSVTVIKDRDTGASKGFAFVEMSSQVEAQKAVGMFNAYNLNNRELRVSPARPREEGGNRFGGGGPGQGRRPGGGGGARGGGNKERQRY